MSTYVLYSVGALALGAFGAILYGAIESRIAYERFKKKLPNVPFIDIAVGWSGHNLDTLRGARSVQIMLDQHRKHGDTVAFLFQNLHTVSTLDLDLIKHIALDRASVNINRITLGLPIHEIEVDSIFTSKDDQWRRIRRAFAPAIRPVRFKSPNVLAEIDVAIEKLTSAIDSKMDRLETDSCEFNIEDLIRRYSLQLVMSCLYKQNHLVNFNLDEKCHWVDLVDLGLIEVVHNPFIRFAFSFPVTRHIVDWLSYNFHPFGRWRQAVFAFMTQQSMMSLEARKQLASEKKVERIDSVDGAEDMTEVDHFIMKDGTKFSRNMMDYVLDQFHAGKLTKSEFFNSSFALFGAADKTASDALVFTLYQLAINQKIQQKLRDSVRAHGEESEFLDWVLKESLRLYPPAPIGCTRLLSESVKLKQGDTLEPGTLVFTLANAIHRLEKYWGPDAEEYKPERWSAADKFHPCQYIPFGAGLRGCPGREFALFEMKRLLSALIDGYSFECAENGDIYEFRFALVHIQHFKYPVGYEN